MIETHLSIGPIAEPSANDQVTDQEIDQETDQEIVLADSFHAQVAIPTGLSEGDLLTKSEIEQSPLSLPAALCDDRLIDEISSIPNKMGFKIGEVAEMLAIKQYVLRYWESEFDVLNPKKASNNQRYYTRKDVENAFIIRKLLHRDRFSIEGARAALRDLKSFVKLEVKKEREWNHISHKIESVQDYLAVLLADIRRLKQYFRS